MNGMMWAHVHVSIDGWMIPLILGDAAEESSLMTMMIEMKAMIEER